MNQCKSPKAPLDIPSTSLDAEVGSFIDPPIAITRNIVGLRNALQISTIKKVANFFFTLTFSSLSNTLF